MKRILALALLTFACFGLVDAQSTAEREIRLIQKGFDEAFVKGDIAYFERHFAPEYIYTNNFAELFSRAENLEYLGSFKTNPPFKVISSSSDNVKVRVVGNAALLTSDWTTTVRSNIDPKSEPHTDTGRFTIFFEQRNGKWLVIAEHSSEKNHDKSMMERQVLKAGQGHFELMKRLNSGRSYAESERSGDIRALDRLFADEFTYTGPDGLLSNKTEELAWYKASDVKLESSELSEQNVRIVSNYSAVETGRIMFVGTSRGKPFNYSKRYTTTWVWRDFRWQIVSDHASVIKR